MSYKSLFLDTNVFIDYLIPNSRFHEPIALVIEQCKREKIFVKIAMVSVCTACYLFEKDKIPSIDVKSILLKISKGFVLCNGAKSTLELSASSNFTDLEDAILFFTAVENQCDAFITRNLKDFPEPHIIPVQSPAQFLESTRS